MGAKSSRGGGATQFDAHLETWTKSVAKALAHPTRIGILERLEEVGQTSPSQAADGGSASLPAVAYHMRELKSAGLIRASGTRRARGAVEHFYELTDRGRAAVSAIDQVLGMTPPAPQRGGGRGRGGRRSRQEPHSAIGPRRGSSPCSSNARKLLNSLWPGPWKSEEPVVSMSSSAHRSAIARA